MSRPDAGPRRARRALSLRANLFAVVLMAMLPTVACALFLGAGSASLARHMVMDRLADSAQAIAGSVDQEIDRAITGLGVLAGSHSLDEGGDAAEFAARCRLFSELMGSDVLLRRRQGQAVLGCQNQPTRPPPEPAAAALAADVLAQGRPAISDIFAGPVPMIAVAAPVLRGGVPIAVLWTTIPSDRLSAALRRQLHPFGGLSVVLDRQGRIAAATQDAARLAGQLFAPKTDPATAGWRRLARLFAPEPAETMARADLAHAPGWQVLATDEAMAWLVFAPSPLNVSLMAALAAAVLGLGVAAVLGERLTRPLRTLTELVRNVAIGGERPLEPMPPSGVAEFEELRQGMVRADAVLRRRGAAERMALREARTGHELLGSVVNGLAESIYVKDLELRHVLVNRAALLSGPEPRLEWQVLGRGTADLFPAALARRIEQADRTVLATGRMTSFEQDYEAPDRHDGRRWLQMTITPWKNAEGHVLGVVSVSRDTTLARLAEARMRAIQADLLRATRLSAMGAMASGLAHELNQPLAAATNYLNAGGRLLERGVLGCPKSFEAARGAVANGAQQMLRAGAIVRRLRDFVERGEVELQPAEVGDLLRDACDLARNDGLTEGIALRVEIGPESGLALVDRTQIQQVLLNLIRNAAEAIGAMTPPRPGEIVVSAQRLPRHGTAEGSIVIEVRDNGPGLLADIAERLFEPFVSSKHTGMGIGLSICRTIVEGHGGRLSAEPNTQAGCNTQGTAGMVFRIALPALHPPGDVA